MSPPRRRSARLASTTMPPKPAPPTSLSSLVERDESPEDMPTQSLNAIVSSPMLRPPRTPGNSSPPKPPMSEMHPSKARPAMMPPSSILRLGFTDIKQPGTKDASDTTPSKVVPSSDFTFRFVRPNAGLSDKAQQMMEELRGEAMKIKAELAAKRQQDVLEDEEMHGRKFAQPKGKAGRYSAAHLAEFKKMDSIENHPSAFRAQPGRFTPLTKGLKRTQSKANFDDSESAPGSRQMPALKGLKRTQSKANLDDSELAPSSRQTPAASLTKSKQNIYSSAHADSASPSKRFRKQLEDDASTNRPVSRDGSFIPRPATAGKDHVGIPRSQTTASFMTPTKASMASTVRPAEAKTPTHRLFVKSPSKPVLTGMKKSATTNNLAHQGDNKQTPVDTPVKGPSRLEKVKSILRRNKSTTKKEESALPVSKWSLSKTPAPQRHVKELPPLPLTTPGKKIAKRVDFTPDTKRAALMQNSPSPFKSGIPRSTSRVQMDDVRYPSLDSMMEDVGPVASEKDVLYPDLSAHRPLPELPTEDSKSGSAPEDVPGTFTFRSDHTIHFGSTSPSGFGTSPSQVSLRPVRMSVLPTVGMPGSFPSSRAGTVDSDKENFAPAANGRLDKPIMHGISNKKRHRATADEEDEAEREATERAAKKRRNTPVPQGEALLAPRLMAHKTMTPSSPKKLSALAGTPSPVKKKTISMSRLNMLARPKLRK